MSSYHQVFTSLSHRVVRHCGLPEDPAGLPEDPIQFWRWTGMFQLLVFDLSLTSSQFQGFRVLILGLLLVPLLHTFHLEDVDRAQNRRAEYV